MALPSLPTARRARATSTSWSRRRWFPDRSRSSQQKNRGSGPDFHLCEQRAAERAVGIGERLGQLEVVVALGADDLGALPRAGEGVGEIARLALELRRLERAVDDGDRRLH